MKTVIRTSSHEIRALLGYALDRHQTDGHNADIEACDDPICALANALDGVDPEAGTFESGRRAITITVETREEEPAPIHGSDSAGKRQLSETELHAARMCGVAMYFDLDTEELEQILSAAGLDYHTVTPGDAAKAVRAAGKLGGPFAR